MGTLGGQRRVAIAAALMAVVLVALLGAWFATGWHDVRAREAAIEDAPVVAAAARAGQLAQGLRAELDQLVEREAARPYFHYQNLFHDPRAPGENVTPSPLASGPEDPLILGYFQIDANARVTTPSINDQFPQLSEAKHLVEHRAFRDAVALQLAQQLAPPRGALIAQADPPPRPPRHTPRMVSAQPPGTVATQAIESPNTTQTYELDPNAYTQNSNANAVYSHQTNLPENNDFGEGWTNNIGVGSPAKNQVGAPHVGGNQTGATNGGNHGANVGENKTGATSSGNQTGATSGGNQTGATNIGENQSGSASGGANHNATNVGENQTDSTNGATSGANHGATNAGGNQNGSTSGGNQTGATNAGGNQTGSANGGNQTGATSGGGANHATNVDGNQAGETSGGNHGASNVGENRTGATSGGAQTGATSGSANHGATNVGGNRTGATSGGAQTGATSGSANRGATNLGGNQTGATSSESQAGANTSGTNQTGAPSGGTNHGATNVGGNQTGATSGSANHGATNVGGNQAGETSGGNHGASNVGENRTGATSGGAQTGATSGSANHGATNVGGNQTGASAKHDGAPSGGNIAGAARPVTITVSSLEWHTLPFSGGASLVAVREVQTPDGNLAQGFVVDRAAMTSWLADHAGDLVAELHPRGDAVAHSVELVPGWELTVEPNPREMASSVSEAAHVATGFIVRFLIVGAIALLAAMLVVWLVARAERYAHERSQFAAAAAHELRTPLAGLQLYGDMLSDGLGDPAKLRDYARRMSEEASRLGRVVSNVLGFSQLERGNLSIDPKLGDVAAALRELAENVQPTFDRAAAAIDLDVPESLEARFDRDALARIVGNLLDNAEKYTRDAEDRTIHLSAQRTGTWIEVAVRDHGSGVASPTKLFQAFARGVSTDGPAGLGLGLALSRSLATAMGGELAYREGDGATFVLRIPVA